jgi:ADP-ribosylglycohydrolase
VALLDGEGFGFGRGSVPLDDGLGGRAAPFDVGAACSTPEIPGRRQAARNAGRRGSVMRAYPFGVMFHADRAKAGVCGGSLEDGASHAAGSCGLAAMARGTLAALPREAPAAIVAAMVEAAQRHDTATADLIRGALVAAQTEAPESVLSGLQGWAAHEAIAAAAYVFARHPDDARSALLEAVNSPGDGDSIGSLVGARRQRDS